MREPGTGAASPLWSGARGTPLHSPPWVASGSKAATPPLLPRGSGEGRRPDGSRDQRGGKCQRGGGQQGGGPGSPAGEAWRTGVGGEVRGAWDLPYSGLGPVPPQFWPRGTDPAGQLPRPFSRTPRRHGGSRGLACAPRGSASACRFRVSPRREGGDVASTLLGRGPPDAACGNASRSIRFLIEVGLGFKSN